MYEKVICILRHKNINLTSGLTQEEFSKIEELYHFRFPLPLQLFLKEVLPIEKGFYNWRDFSPGNISRITNAIESPKRFLHQIINEIDWCDDWGKEPKNLENKAKLIKNKIITAPDLIPIFAHRYMPVCALQNPPVISVHGADVIYYGENLENYLEIEFGDKKQASINFESIEYIPFWTDLM